MDNPGSNPVTHGIDGFLDRKIEERGKADVEKFARKGDGTIDEDLARRIRWEIGRRGETGKQLDIYEPLRWTVIRTALGIAGAGVAKAISDRLTGKNKQLFFNIEIATIVTTAISSAIDLLRLYPRWLSGLEGGRNTALKLHNEFTPPPNDQAFTASAAEHRTQARNVAKPSGILPTSLLKQAERRDSGQTHFK